MSMSGLSVRWLASTSVPGAERERSVGFEGQEDVEIEDDTKEQGNGRLSGGEESDDEVAESDGKGSARAATPASSQESTDSDSDSASSTDSDGAPSSPPSTLKTSCIQEAQLSPDGTCIFTSDYSRTFSVYPLNPTIFSSPTTQPLQPYAQFTSADPIWAFAANPLFNLQDPSSTHVLVSRRDRYITLHNALWDTLSLNPSTSPSPPPSSPINIHTPLTSYKLINHLTEAVTAPLSLAYTPSGTHFLAGSTNSIALFDLSHPSSPVRTIRTIPSTRSKLKHGGRGFKGAISALATAPTSDSLLAAGARTRCVALYDVNGGGGEGGGGSGEITHFSLPGSRDGRKLHNSSDDEKELMGDGVSSLKFSPCGRYLYVAERGADVLLIYDVRHFTLALGYCKGRNARTKQRLGFDVWSAGGEGHEVWAGGVDGRVRVWRDPWAKGGGVEADEVVDVGGAVYGGGGGGGGGEDEEVMPVVSTLVHSSGSLGVVARGMVGVGEGGGNRRGGGVRPRVYEQGCLDIFGLSGF